LRQLLKTMRPKQWAKNVFIFVGIFFDGKLFVLPLLVRAFAAFVVFCLVSSAIYLINDLADMARDRLHPVKRNRPLASGALAPITAKIAAIAILVICLPAAFYLDTIFGVVTLIYAMVMVLYSFYLKHFVIVDVMTVATGFVLRVFGGTAVVHVSRFSPWLYLCTILLALFIAISKRRNELHLLSDNANNHRSSLQEYTFEFLDDMTSLVTATAVTAYSFYTFSAPNLPANHSMMLTIPLVLYVIFRYLYLVRVKNLGGAPEDIILGDKPLLIGSGLFVLIAAIVLYTSGLVV